MSTKAQQVREEEITIGNSELPEGWCSAFMGDICDVLGGGTPKSTEADNFSQSGFAWITPADLSGYEEIYISKGARSLSEKGLRACSAIEMPPGTVLMSSRAPIGYLAIAANTISTNQGFKSFVLAEGFVPEYCYYWLKYKRSDLEQMGSGSTFLEISGSRAKEIPIIVAPTSEQERISEELTCILSASKAPLKRMERVKLITQRFRQAVLAAACSGKLTEDWRKTHGPDSAMERWQIATPPVVDAELPDLPDGWVYRRLEDVSERVSVGHVGPTSLHYCQRKEGVPFVRSQNVRPGTLDLSGLNYITRSFHVSLRKSQLFSGDLLPKLCTDSGSSEARLRFWI
jgi:type I restriction enzyme, S subunit